MPDPPVSQSGVSLTEVQADALIARHRASEAEAERLREALLEAAADLDKAANQFQGLYGGILRQYVESGAIPGVNAERFAEKAQRAREAADA